MYDPRFTEPMRRELTDIGVTELRTPEEVDAAFGEKTGTTLIMVNSVCGCAAGMARPGLREALRESVRPDRVVTVFAGVDVEAAKKARGYFASHPPSSPSFALFKDGKVVHFIPRHKIEGRDAGSLAAELKSAFAAHCGATATEDIDATRPIQTSALPSLT
jgi:putative YphP/YqiW family bacilliredoxin